MSSCQLMFPGFRSFLEFSSFGLSLLPLAFSLILTELHGKEKRKEGYRSDQEEKRGNLKEIGRSSKQSVP